MTRPAKIIRDAVDEAWGVEPAPNALAAEYREREGTLTGAVRALVADLMRDEPEQFKRGYSYDNAKLAAAEVFGYSPAAVREATRDLDPNS